MSNPACVGRPVRRVGAQPFGFVEQGGDRAYNNVTVSNVLTVGSQLTVPVIYCGDLASLENLNISVCENLNVVANNGTLAFGHDLNIDANDTITLAAPNVIVDGNLIVNGALDVCDIVCLNGNMTIDSNNVHFTGNANVNGNLDVEGTLIACHISCPSGNLTVNSNLVSFSNNVNINNTLQVCDIICTGTLDINANNIIVNTNTLTITNFLNVEGNANFANEVNIGGTLNVCTIQCPNGDVTINDNLIVNGNITIQNGELFVCTLSCPNGNVTINDNLTVNGTTTINGATTINGDTTINGNLNVCTIQCPNGDVTINDNLNVNGQLFVCTISCPNGNVTIADNLTVTQNTITDNLLVNNFATINNLTVNNLNITTGGNGNFTNINVSNNTVTNNLTVNVGATINALSVTSINATIGAPHQLFTRDTTNGHLFSSNFSDIPTGAKDDSPLAVEPTTGTVSKKPDAGMLEMAFRGTTPGSALIAAGPNVNTVLLFDTNIFGNTSLDQTDFNYYPANGYIEYNTAGGYAGFTRTFTGALQCSIDAPSENSWVSVRLGNDPNINERYRSSNFDATQKGASIPFIFNSQQAAGFIVTFTNMQGTTRNFANGAGASDTQGIQNTLSVARISP